MTSRWQEAIEEAKSNLGYYPNEYIQDWDSVVQEAKDILAYEREEEYQNFCDDAKLEYKDYLKSKNWKHKRVSILLRDRFKCRLCGRPASEVHHRTYDNLHTEKELTDCISVCRICHKKQHKITKKGV